MKTKQIDLYTSDGWLNIPAIAGLGCWMNIIIGARQVGKTYGTLDYMLRNDKHFIFMRRTKEELETITSNAELSPFIPFEPYFRIDLEKVGKSYVFGDYETDEDGKRHINKERGIAMSLSMVSKVRGFDGSSFSDLVFDEIVPQEGDIVRQTEGGSFLNALITIEGNRVLKGHPPLRSWLLANSNNLDCPILRALELTNDIERMIARDEEYKITKSGIFLAHPKSSRVTGQRSNTPLMRHLSNRSKVKKMAISNEFSYNDLSLVKKHDLKGWKCIFSVGDLYFYEDAQGIYYVTNSKAKCKEVYSDSHDDIVRCNMNHIYLKLMHTERLIHFSSAENMFLFQKYFL